MRSLYYTTKEKDRDDTKNTGETDLETLNF